MQARGVTYDGLVPHGDSSRWFRFRSLVAPGVPHATTTRHFDGTTAFRERGAPFREGAAIELGPTRLDLARVAYARQVTAGGLAGTADVLATTEPDVPLAVFTADCLAITLVGPSTRPVLPRGGRAGQWGANEDLLVGAGVTRIENPRLCTACQTAMLFFVP